MAKGRERAGPQPIQEASSFLRQHIGVWGGRHLCLPPFSFPSQDLKCGGEGQVELGHERVGEHMAGPGRLAFPSDSRRAGLALGKSLGAKEQPQPGGRPVQPSPPSCASEGPARGLPEAPGKRQSFWLKASDIWRMPNLPLLQK